jgi:hypothetical protein
LNTNFWILEQVTILFGCALSSIFKGGRDEGDEV